MAYSAEISRGNPSCLVFLIDQSGSMNDPFGAGEGNQKKADGVADAINRLLQNLVIKCAKEEGIPLVAIYCNSIRKPAYLPRELSGVRVLNWTWVNIGKFMDRL